MADGGAGPTSPGSTTPRSTAAGLGDPDLCFTARALAQTHPMTEAARRYHQRCSERERERQPVSELADWAGTALLVGYCLRRAEETEARRPSASPPPGSPTPAGVDALALDRTNEAGAVDRGVTVGVAPGAVDQPGEAGAVDRGVSVGVAPGADDLAAGAGAVAAQLRSGDPGSVTLLPAEETVAALDRLIATEIDKRRDHLREQLDDDAWNELEDYLAWWVVHGYGVRVVETRRAAPGSPPPPVPS